MYYTNLAGAPPGRKQTRQGTAKINKIKEYGEVAEWFKALVLKTGVEQSTEGSNPSLSVFFLPKTRLFVVVRSVGYLRAAARVPTVFLPPLTPRINGFSFEKRSPLTNSFCPPSP